jgi:hypothetical protein
MMMLPSKVSRVAFCQIEIESATHRHAEPTPMIGQNATECSRKRSRPKLNGYCEMISAIAREQFERSAHSLLQRADELIE